MRAFVVLNVLLFPTVPRHSQTYEISRFGLTEFLEKVENSKQ